MKSQLRSDFARRVFNPLFMSCLILCFGLYLGGNAATGLVQAWQEGRQSRASQLDAPAVPTEALPAPPQTDQEVASLTVNPQAVFTVSNTNDSGSGSLRQAITSALGAGAGPHFIEAGGVTGTISLQSALPTITNSTITINGPTSGTLTVTRGVAANFRIFTVTNASGAASLTINRLTMTNGNPGTGTSDNGGAISVTDSALTLNFCTISGCSAGGQGGGVNAEGTTGATLVINFCTISGNTAASSLGGGVCVRMNSVAPSPISTLLMTNSTVSGNTVTGGGAGGVNLTYTAGTFRNCTISGNSSGAGNAGGISVASVSSLAMTNCTMTNNRCASGSSGGGIRSLSGNSVTLTNTLVVGNFNGPTGTTADDTSWTNGTGTFTAVNSVIGADGGGGFDSSTASQVGTTASPKVVNLGALTNNGGPTQTHALLATVPELAINLGDNTSASSLASDQRGIGFNRFNGIVDIGAFENGSTSPSFTGVTALGAPAQVTGVTSLTYTVPPGTNRLLVVTASNATSTTIGSVSFGASVMTMAVQKNDGFAMDSIWSLALGTSTSSDTRTITVTGFSTAVNTVLTAQTFQNVDQTTPIDGTLNNAATGTSVGSTLTLLTTTANDLVFDLFDCFVNSGAITATPGAGQAMVHGANLSIVSPSGGIGRYVTSIKPAVGSSTTMSWASNTIAIIQLAANINYAPACSTITGAVTGGGTICAGSNSTVTVTVTGGTPPYSVTLNNGGGTQTGSSPLTFTVSPSSTTTYSV
ncbi:MAG TPA: choice-of-anchor Q domain-containing protein, partial [Acidobacteriota bacterium]|nr:choice-of-anchor Q domain-containing protein [Acidobacteriota bacterium]